MPYLLAAAVVVALAALLAWLAERRQRIVALRVSFTRRQRVAPWRSETMWVPVDQIEVGDSCNVRVTGIKKSGAHVPLAAEQVTVTDGTTVEIVGLVATGKEEGLAIIQATLKANPDVYAFAELAVADPIVELLVETGRDQPDPGPEPEPDPGPAPEPEGV